MFLNNWIYRGVIYVEKFPNIAVQLRNVSIERPIFKSYFTHYVKWAGNNSSSFFLLIAFPFFIIIFPAGSFPTEVGGGSHSISCINISHFASST